MLASSDAVEIIKGDSSHAPLFFTCEHASQRLPSPYSWRTDRRLRGTHWAYDIGARALTHRLARENHAIAILSRFTRLLVDPNRPEDHPDLFRNLAEGRPVRLNQDLTSEERARRIARFYDPYHRSIDDELGTCSARVLLAVHSFTPVYEGVRRAVELGVLFDEAENLAVVLRETLEQGGFRNVGMNVPYSGKRGLMYSVERHAHKHGRRALEIEVRQDLIGKPAFQDQLARAIQSFAQLLRSPRDTRS